MFLNIYKNTTYKNFKSILAISSQMYLTNHIEQSSTNDARNPMPNRTVGHAHMLAKEDAILDVHMHNINYIFI